MTPEEAATGDQNVSFLGDWLPSIFRRIYEGAIEREFTEQQAMALVIAYAHGCGGGRFQ